MKLQKACFDFKDKENNFFQVCFIPNTEGTLNSRGKEYDYKAIIFKNEVEECTWTTSQFVNKSNAKGLILESIKKGLIE